jgi:uncharacterized protein (TIGR00297 family)
MAFLALVLKKLDITGALSGILIAYVVWIGSGDISLISLCVFFVVGTMASAWKKDKKEAWQVAQESAGQRNYKNVLANGGTAGIFSVAGLFIREPQINLTVMVIASFSAACSDTLSSELGNIYGKKYYDIITWKRAIRGTDGAVSLEGIVFGLIGCIIVGLIPAFFKLHWGVSAIVAASGFLGNLIDSLLGATLQQKQILNNHSVNFVATLSSAVISFALMLLLLS